MAEQGVKRPRDEHGWTDDVCMICKEVPPRPFRVLNPECMHGVCDTCIRTSGIIECGYCKRNVLFTTRVFTTPFGETIIARCALDNELVIKKTVDFYSPVRECVDMNDFRAYMQCDDREFNGTTSGRELAREFPHLTEFLTATGVLFQKDTAVKLEKYKERLGSNARVVQTDEHVFLIMGRVVQDGKGKYNTVLITPVYTCKARIKSGQVRFYQKNEYATYARMLLAATDRVFTEDAQKARAEQMRMIEKYRAPVNK